MTNPLTAGCLLAQITKWERLGDEFRRSNPRFHLNDALPYLIGVLILGGIVAGFLAYRRRNDLSRPCSDNQKLFRELCQVHNLDRNAQQLLTQLAEGFGLAQPAEVFVRPSVFAPEQLPEHLRGEAARIAELQQRLF